MTEMVEHGLILLRRVHDIQNLNGNDKTRNKHSVPYL